MRASAQKSLSNSSPRSTTTPATTGPKSAMAAMTSGSRSIAAAAASHHSREGKSITGRPAQRASLAAEDLADGGEDPFRLRLGCIALRRDAAPLGLFLPGSLERLGSVAGGERALADLAADSLDGHPQEALLVEDEVDALAGRLGRELQGAQVFVVDDAVAVALEDVQLQALPALGRRKAE